ncbi:MAG: hypothetical protein GX421_06705 [Caldisericales bacterium]|nr:hypothetical protein [Caldisericales bacterium]
MGKIEKYKEYNSVLIAFIVFLSVLAFSTWIMGELGFWGDFSESKDTFLYFFSSAAQTMGAIIAIVLTAIYALVTAIRPSDNPAIEPTKRLMFRDTALLGAVYPGLGMIIASLFGVLFVYTTRANILIMFLMAALVVGTAIYSVGNLIYFLFVRGPMYLNPVLLIRCDIFNNKEATRDNIKSDLDQNSSIDYSIVSLLLSSSQNELDTISLSLFILFDPNKNYLEIDSLKVFFDKFLRQFKSDCSIMTSKMKNDIFNDKLLMNILGSIDIYYIKPNLPQIDLENNYNQYLKYIEFVTVYSDLVIRIIRVRINHSNEQMLPKMYDAINHWVLDIGFKDILFSFMQDPDGEPGFGTIHEYRTNLNNEICVQHFNRWFDLMNLLNFKLIYDYSFFRTNNLQFKAFNNLMILEPAIDTNEQFLKLLQNVTASFVMDLHKIFTYMINIAADDKENAETQKYIKRIEYLIDPFKNFIEKYYKNEEEKKYITSGFYIEDLDPDVMNVIRYMLFCKNVIVGIYYHKLLAQRMMYIVNIRNTNWSIIGGISDESKRIYNLMYDENSEGRDQIDLQELRDSFEIGFALAKSIMLVKKVKLVIGDMDGIDQKEIANKYFEYIKSTREVTVHLDYFLAGVEYGIRFEEFLERNDVS